MYNEHLAIIESLAIKATPFRWEHHSYNHLVEQDVVALGGGKAITAAAEWWWTNVFRTILLKKAKSMSIKLTAQYWTNNQCNIGYRGVKRIIDHYSSIGHITVYKGFVEAFNKSNRVYHPTIVIFTSSFLEAFNGIIKRGVGNYEEDITKELKKIDDSVHNIQSVIVRGAEQGDLVIPSELISEIDGYNDYLSHSVIKLYGEPIPLLQYRRVFNGSLAHGGRLYAIGGNIQTMPSKHRLAGITINDNPVVELDYSSNHPSILYERLMIKRDASFDVYGCDITDCVVTNDSYSTAEQKEAMRRIVKKGVLCAINSCEEREAVAALGYFFHKTRYEELSPIVSIRSVDVLRKITEHNIDISSLFYRSVGLELQKVDSDIALRVIDKLQQLGVTTLCWHDSFVVEECFKSHLALAMSEAWKEELGNDEWLLIK